MSLLWRETSLGPIQQGAEKIAKKFAARHKHDKTIDLHGLNSNQCMDYLPEIIQNSWEQYHRSILIIHGVGQGILKNIVLEYCYEHPLLLACLRAPDKIGGDGATILLFKRRNKSD